MWSLILVLASGVHLTFPLAVTTVESTELRSCMAQGKAAADEINKHVADADKVVQYGCRREA